MAHRLNGSVNLSRPACQVDFNSFTGLPYRDLGRGPDAYDCWGLVVAVYDAAGIKLPSYAESYVTAEDLKSISCLISGSLQPWREISEREVKPLDGVLVNIAGYERHIGLVVKRGYMLHVGLDLGPSRIERYDAMYLRKRISRFMRHEALT
jgi:cell wall-associated NlpC family hydrolase